MKPQFKGVGGKEIILGGEKGSEIIQRLQARIRPDMFPNPGAFDGKKNLYATQSFNFSTQLVSADSSPLLYAHHFQFDYAVQFLVPWERDQIQSTEKSVEVRIARVRAVDISVLGRLLDGEEQGNPEAIGPGTNIASSLNMLQLFLQAAPRCMAAGALHKGKSTYIQWHRDFPQSSHQKRLDENLRPLKLLDGLFQSVRPTIGNLIVNIDLSVGVVVPRMPLEELCARYLRLRDARDFRNLSRADYDKLRHFLRDVKITIVSQQHSSKTKARRIRGLIQDVGSQTFDKQGYTVTVRDHFLELHQKDIQRGTLGVLVGQHEMFPIFSCHVPEQLYKSKLNPDQIREVLSFVPQKPADRLGRIRAGWQNLGYGNSPYLTDAKIQINSNPLSITGRILPAPSIQYGPQLKPYLISLDRRPGSWDVMNRVLFSPFQIPYVMFLNLTGGNATRDMGQFREQLLGTMKDRGITITSTSSIVDDNGADIGKTIPIIASKLNAPKKLLLIAILPDSAAELYASVKRAGDIELGVPTQCVRWNNKLLGCIRNNKGLDQYLNNLILKINARCGGINHVPSSHAMSYLSNSPTMIIGADVSHPSPGSAAPSFASLVSEAKYTGQISMQSSRQEIIESLPELMSNALNMFFKENEGRLPERIFFFRDGVSEGEFETVREHELNNIKKMLDRKFHPHKRPAITFIVVGKRHHFRFFPKHQDADRSGNCPSGFVVDRGTIVAADFDFDSQKVVSGIEHPVYSDFYLQSQPGLKGTSIPAHYTVIEDENLEGDADKLQAVAYALCHSYQRSTRSVKIPAPVYYADLVCRRAKFHFSSQYSSHLDGLSDAASDEQPNIMRDFKQLHPDLHKTMHFM
ncbi:hypothetical protein D9757_006175 [Collybiopsis confluens]|uniref:Piwi domain-containing protein n=1 Tax=Collybiopsis confluens TaxID=2823264 RepID=A0A8H5HHX6_9AGAR|nr:hypothetical protein D9757_006175 [Collybiopsis confluens]